MDSLVSDSRLWIGLGALLYVAAFLYGLLVLLRGVRYPRVILLSIVAGGFLLQSLGVYMRGIHSMSCPLGNTFEVLQFISWSLVLLYLVIGPAFRMSLLGLFSSGMAAIISATALLVPAWDGPVSERPFGDNPWIETHASLAIFSYGIFAMLALTALMYLLQNISLKQKWQEAQFRFLPSIWELDQMNRRLLLSALVVLSISLLVGAKVWHSGDVPSIKLVTTILVWFAYLMVLGLRLGQRMGGRMFAWMCLSLFAAAMLSLWAVNAARASAHDAEPPPAVERPADTQF